MTRPFEGVKILDFTQVLAGPYASYQLALLGADVVDSSVIRSTSGSDTSAFATSDDIETRM